MTKRILWAIFCLSLTLTGYASQLTATLQSGDKVTPFYGSNAFVDAYNAAVDSDIITLSSGTFNTIEIEKSIKIIGSYGFSGLSAESTIIDRLIIIADNVTIEGIYCKNGITIKAADNSTIKRSRMGSIIDSERSDKKYHNNTLVSDCMIDNFGAMEFSNNIVIRNCFINYFSDINDEDKVAYIVNNRINLIAHITMRILMAGTQYATVSRSISPVYTFPNGIYKFNYIGIICNLSDDIKGTYLDVNALSDFQDNLFMTYYESGKTTKEPCRIDCGGKSIDDNNVRVLYSTPLNTNSRPSFDFSYFRLFTYKNNEYGPKDPKYNPAIPIISSCLIDDETDKGGILHIRISAEARD